jgi:hypothetical protein
MQENHLFEYAVIRGGAQGRTGRIPERGCNCILQEAGIFTNDVYGR